jgi:hypothetical protein
MDVTLQTPLPNPPPQGGREQDNPWFELANPNHAAGRSAGVQRDITLSRPQFGHRFTFRPAPGGQSLMPRPRPLSCVLTTRGALLLALVPAHLKSGGDNGDEFRRALESFRLRQIANAANRDAVPLIMLGDMNADSGDPPPVSGALYQRPQWPADRSTPPISGCGIVRTPGPSIPNGSSRISSPDRHGLTVVVTGNTVPP